MKDDKMEPRYVHLNKKLGSPPTWLLREGSILLIFVFVILAIVLYLFYEYSIM